MSLRINNGKPEWSARGADTWSPFINFDKKQTKNVTFTTPQLTSKTHTLTFEALSKIDGFLDFSMNVPNRLGISSMTTSGNKITFATYHDGYNDAKLVVNITAFELP